MPKSNLHVAQRNLIDPLRRFAGTAAVAVISGMNVGPVVALEEGQVIKREDVGPISLNETMPKITDVCFMDIQVGESPSQRIEISLFGTVAPIASTNFKQLCSGENGFGYKNSDIFRVISTFSIQGGNIGAENESAPSKIGRYGKAASGTPFPAENYRILHDAPDAGVVSMMKDIVNKVRG